MKWQDIRERFPDQWLLVEALNAKTVANKRILDQLTVVDMFPDGTQGMWKYQELHRQDPFREYYVLHTSREQLDLTELKWLGLRPAA